MRFIQLMNAFRFWLSCWCLRHQRELFHKGVEKLCTESITSLRSYCIITGIGSEWRTNRVQGVFRTRSVTRFLINRSILTHLFNELVADSSSILKFDSPLDNQDLIILSSLATFDFEEWRLPSPLKLKLAQRHSDTTQATTTQRKQVTIPASYTCSRLPTGTQ